MSLLNRGAIANFFGLADEEEYEYEDYPEQQQVAKQPTKSNTQYQQHSPAVSQPIEKNNVQRRHLVRLVLRMRR